MNAHQLFEALWQQFIQVTPQANQIHQQLKALGESPINDHVAFRTFSDCPVDIEHLTPVLEALGYRFQQHYDFSAKKLTAGSYECPGLPKIFLSELRREQLSDDAQAILQRLIDPIPDQPLEPNIFCAGRLWTLPSHADYQALANESEYAGWLAVWGLRANHFTVSLNDLNRRPSVMQMNEWVKDWGFAINASGGEVKGTAEDLLEQSSTLADRVTLKFEEGEFEVPSCFYEFALRHPMPDGQLYPGFVAANANKIFESTHR